MNIYAKFSLLTVCSMGFLLRFLSVRRQLNEPTKGHLFQYFIVRLTAGIQGTWESAYRISLYHLQMLMTAF